MAGVKRGCLTVLAVLLLGALLLAAAGAWFWHSQSGFADQPISPDQPSMVIASGDGLQTVLRNLRKAGVDEGSDTQWQLLARQLDASGKLKVGEYALDPSLTPRELLTRMRQGRTLQHRVTIVEGWNIRQLRAALKRADPLVHTTDSLDDAALMKALGFPDQHPEGRFLPETYVYQRGDTDVDVLKRAHAAMEKELAAAWESRADDLPLNTPYELLILASIIEKKLRCPASARRLPACSCAASRWACACRPTPPSSTASQQLRRQHPQARPHHRHPLQHLHPRRAHPHPDRHAGP
jgi:UPF0755 protein